MTSSLPSDSALPGLDRLGDRQVLSEIFHGCLRSECQTHSYIKSVDLIRFRYRPSSRYIGHYRVRVRDNTTQKVATQWLTVMTYADERARRIYKKMRSDLPETTRHNEFSTFRPLSYRANDDLLIQAFPTDRYLSQIGIFLKGPPADVMTCMLDRFGPGNWKVSNVNVELRRYRPLLGLTLRYRIEGCDDSKGVRTRNFFVKLYRGNECSDTWKKLTQLHRDLGTYKCTFRLLYPGTLLKHHRALILDQVAGQPLNQILTCPDTNIDRIMERVARAMFELHNSPLNPAGKLLDEKMSLRADRGVALMSNDRPDFARVLMRIRTALRGSRPVFEPRPAHCDLKAEHLLIDGSHVTFIDLDSTAMADPVYDLAMMLIRLQVMSTLEGIAPDVADAAADGLLEHYFRLAPTAWRDRLPHQLGNAGIKVALFFVQHRIPGWAKKTRILLDQIEVVLKGKTKVIPGRFIP